MSSGCSVQWPDNSDQWEIYIYHLKSSMKPQGPAVVVEKEICSELHWQASG